MIRVDSLWKSRSRHFWPLLLVLILALGARVWFGSQVREDAYITLRYVQNLLAGNGFVYNSGEFVLGTSTPLFTIILAGLGALGADPTVAAVVVGVVADLTCIALVYAIGVRVASHRAGLLSALLYGIAAPIVAYSVSGMETPLYIAMILAAFLAWDAGRLSSSGILAGAVALMRPEGILVGLTLVVANIHRRRQLSWQMIGWSALILAPWLVFASFYFGSPLPQSMLAKVDLGSEDRWTSLRHLIIYFGDLKARWFLLPTIASAVGITTFAVRRPIMRWLLAWAALYATAFTASNKFLFPIWPFEWYFLPLVPPYLVLASTGLLRLGELVRVHTIRYTAFAAVAILAIFLPVLAQQREALMRVVRGRELLYAELAKTLIDYGARQDAVAAPEIGALGYFYTGPVLDTNGLVSPEAVGRQFADLLRSYQPPWIVSYDTLVPEDLLDAGWFQREYRPVRELVNWEGRKATLFRRYPPPELVETRGVQLGTLARLEDYRVAVQEMSGGRLLHLRLIWRAEKPQSPRYAMFVHLLDGKGVRLAQQDNEPQEGTRPTSSWEEGEILLDQFDLSLPADGDLRDASLEVGAVRIDNPKEALEWRSRGGTVLGQRIRLPVAQPAPKVFSCEVQLEGGISLQGARVGTDETTGQVSISLQWRALQPIGRDYTVFVHLLDGRGKLVVQHDSQPRAASYPTSIWLTKDVVLDEHLVPVPAVALTSVKRIAIGMYDLKTGSRLSLASGAKADALELPLPMPLELPKPGAVTWTDHREIDLCSP